MTRLPRIAVWLLARRLGPEWLECVLGDLEEEFVRRGGDCRWLWNQVARMLLRPPPTYRMAAADGGTRPMGALAADVRQALRSFRRAPLVTGIAVLTLAIGLGANTAVFTLADATVLRPLPYSAPQQLLALRDSQDGEQTPAAYPEYVAWREYLAPMAEVGAYWNVGYTLTSTGEPPLMVAAQRASASTFRLLGITPLAGRLFTDDDDLRTAPRVVLLSEGFWHRRYGADRGVIGRTILLDDIAHEVVGILPRNVRGILPSDASVNPRDLWIPLRLDTTAVPGNLHWLTVVARLHDGVSPEQADQQIAAAAAALRRDGRSEHAVQAVPLVQYVGRSSRETLQALVAAVVLVLLVTCANLGSLLIARGATRAREVGIRLAIGAPRWRVARQFAIESLLLALCGGALGLVVAWGALEWFRLSQPLAGIDVATVGLHARVFLFTLLISVGSALLFGLAPALQVRRVRIEGAFIGGAHTGGTRLRLRRAFVIAEVAMAVVLLAGAGLLARSFSRLLDTDWGFRADGVLTFEVHRPSTSPDRHTLFFSELLERLERLPGVTAAGLTSALPLAGSDVDGAVPIEGITLPDGRPPSAQKRVVSPRYFATLGIPIVKGRGFTERDRAGAPLVVVISEAFARLYFGVEDPLGRRLSFNWEIEGMQEIVGVAGDVRHRGIHLDPLPMVYISYLQRPDSSFTVALQAERGAVSTLPDRVRDVVGAIDPAQPVASFRTLDDIQGRTLAPRRVSLVLTAGFAITALGLVCLGLYGVISFATRQRTREIGVRIALGARPADIVRLVLKEGIGMTVGGLVLGMALAWPAARLVESQLYATSARDPLVLGLAAAVLLAVSMVAAWVPAARAAGLDPTRALRQE